MEIHMRWVPVEEALPDKHQPVILCRQNKEGHLLVEQGCLSVNGWWLVYGTRVKRVKFWMPMPVAPVPEERGERIATPVCAPARNDTGFREVRCG